MSTQNSFRQVDEKHVTSEVICMEWSPKMDLVAVANVAGEVILYRLSWQKVWTLSNKAKGENCSITTLSWRPDGKVIAIGYVTGTILMCDVENSDILHMLNHDVSISSLNWIFGIPFKTDSNSSEIKRDIYEERGSLYLPKLPLLNKNYGTLTKGQADETVEDSKKLKGQTDLNTLLVGTTSGSLHLYAYGIFPISITDFTKNEDLRCSKVISSTLSQDLKQLTVCSQVTQNNQSQYFISCLNTSDLAEHVTELSILSQKYGHITALMGYLEATTKQMSEAWEDILMEMDSKLMKFAEEKRGRDGSAVSNEFLELLLFGTPSAELQAFLLHELTEKGLKKLSHSIETSYSNIQRLVLKQLLSVVQSILYHLGDIYGMSLWQEKFKVLGLDPQNIQKAINTAGSFLLKASELHLVIDTSMKNFKAFFRWLYVVIQRLAGEAVPQELSIKMTQHSFNFVAEFLKDHFTDETELGDGTRPRFRFERVGQYLKNENLQDPVDNSSNPWVKFIESHPSVKENSSLFTVETNKSLSLMYEELKKSVFATLDNTAIVIGQNFRFQHILALKKDTVQDKEVLKIRQFTTDKENGSYTYSVFTLDSTPAKLLYIIRHKFGSLQKEVGCLRFGVLGSGSIASSNDMEASRCKSHKILDIAFYDQKTFSLLLIEDFGSKEEAGLSVLVQLPFASVTEYSYYSNNVLELEKIPVQDVGPSIDPMNYRRLENMKAYSFAVSGTRKVACVVFSSRRRVRLFMMDVEDEEDDDDDEDLENGDEVNNSKNEQEKESADQEVANASIN